MELDRKVIDYKLIRSDKGSDDLSKMVTGFIKAGYQLYGNPFNANYNFYQAVVKYEEKLNEI
jgi:hypothetical protein